MRNVSKFVPDIEELSIIFKSDKICAALKSDDSSINTQEGLEICNVSIEILRYS